MWERPSDFRGNEKRRWQNDTHHVHEHKKGSDAGHKLRPNVKKPLTLDGLILLLMGMNGLCPDERKRGLLIHLIYPSLLSVDLWNLAAITVLMVSSCRPISPPDAGKGEEDVWMYQFV
jgi:hypothetical protein